jgi:hypothetical protein
LAQGVTANALANGAEANCKTYGIELDSYRAEEALTRIDRVGFGSFFRSRISNEAFHAMLLNPPYLSLMTEGGNNTRSEKRFLVDSINNLMIGGLLIYIIPYYRLTADIARVLCDNFSDISIWKFTVGEFKKFKQIAIFGIRHTRKKAEIHKASSQSEYAEHKYQDGFDLVTELSSMVLEPEKLPELTGLPAGRYQLPTINKEVALFKGALFNKNELAEQLSKSNSFSRIFEKSKLDDTTKRPLLPLNIGQIGLVGGSGLINGLVECDTPHIIKGRIVKEKRINTDENTNDKGDLMSTTLTETISNKLIFNLLTPNGFVSLTDYGNIGATEDSGSDSDNDLDDETEKTVNGGGNDANSSICESARFPLGRVVVTRNAREVLTDYDINSALRRHQSGDWGDVSKDDRAANDNAVKHGERILSSYLGSADEEFWIITEWDRSVTTVLLPEDY